MKERGIIFNGAMVRAILSGKKTQTRRIMKQQPPERWQPVTLSCEPDLQARTYTKGVVDRHGCLQAGPEVFGVADEEWGAVSPFGKPGDRLWVRETFGDCGVRLAYRADTDDGAACQVKRWTPSIHMPRAAARILLEITDVRVERLNDISNDDAMAEGMDDGTSEAALSVGWFEKPRRAFQRLWTQIYGQESWEGNPWVWIYEFKQVPASAGKGSV